jgi:hypothetical protein
MGVITTRKESPGLIAIREGMRESLEKPTIAATTEESFGMGTLHCL